LIFFILCITSVTTKSVQRLDEVKVCVKRKKCLSKPTQMAIGKRVKEAIHIEETGNCKRMRREKQACLKKEIAQSATIKSDNHERIEDNTGN
jgi:hypothetical protein